MEKNLKVVHDGESYEIQICWSKEFTDTIDHMPHLSELVSYNFFKNCQYVGSAEVRSNKLMCETMLCYTNDLEAELACLALEILEETDIVAWERCNWNFMIKYGELSSSDEDND